MRTLGKTSKLKRKNSKLKKNPSKLKKKTQNSRKKLKQLEVRPSFQCQSDVKK